MSGLFMIPILAYLVINIYTGSSLGVFFVVLAAMLVAASLVIVPLMVPEDRAFWTFCAFCASLILLLGIVCTYSHGDWFGIAASAVLFGLSLVSLPLLLRARPVKKLIGDSNFLAPFVFFLCHLHGCVQMIRGTCSGLMCVCRDE